MTILGNCHHTHEENFHIFSSVAYRVDFERIKMEKIIMSDSQVALSLKGLSSNTIESKLVYHSYVV